MHDLTQASANNNQYYLQKEQKIVLVLYVDDHLITGNDSHNSSIWLPQKLQAKYQMSHLA